MAAGSVTVFDGKHGVDPVRDREHGQTSYYPWYRDRKGIKHYYKGGGYLTYRQAHNVIARNIAPDKVIRNPPPQDLHAVRVAIRAERAQRGI